MKLKGKADAGRANAGGAEAADDATAGGEQRAEEMPPVAVTAQPSKMMKMEAIEKKIRPVRG